MNSLLEIAVDLLLQRNECGGVEPLPVLVQVVEQELGQPHQQHNTHQ